MDGEVEAMSVTRVASEGGDAQADNAEAEPAITQAA